MGYFTTTQLFLDIPTRLDVKESQKIDKFLTLLDDSKVRENISKYIKNDTKKGGRPNVNYYRLFATTLYAFAFSKATLRQIEDLCKFDLRYKYLMRNETPTFSTICKFIDKIIYPERDDLFSKIIKCICNKMNISTKTIYIDGTKFEANANKYKYVWKPLTFHERLSKSCCALINKYNLLENSVDEKYISSKTIGYAISHIKEKNLSPKNSKNLMKALNNMLLKIIEYEEKEQLCGPNRNSYYKTDTDATAMCLKADYYSGLGSNMHAAYNIQVGICEGIPVSYLCTQSRADLHDFIDVLDKFYNIFSYYPANVAADAGYGSLENYKFLKEHDIKSFVKYQTREGNVSGRCPDCFRLDEDGKYVCLNNVIGEIVKLDNRHPKKANSVFIKFEGCLSCNFMPYCKRFMRNLDENFKIFEVVEDFIKLKQEAENNLLSKEGIEIRVNRSIQAEGVYGDLKQNYLFTRFRRRGMGEVTSEIMLHLLGYAIRKLFRFFETNKKCNFRSAPSDLEPEKFKKPSAKKLSKKGSKQRHKQYKD